MHRSHAVRLAICAAFGLITGLGLNQIQADWEWCLLSGWSVTATIFLSMTWLRIGRLNAAETASHAVDEDETRSETGAVLIAASSISLIGVAFGLVRATSLHGVQTVGMTLICVLAIALSWAVVHTVFVLRYAHEYFSNDGGIEFGSNTPTFSDFAYLAFTIGMTYQVSDTTVANPMIRRTVLRHALLSFVFGTAIVATTINVIAGLLNRT